MNFCRPELIRCDRKSFYAVAFLIRFTISLVFILVASGCASSTELSSATYSIGRPIEVIEGILLRREGTMPGAVAWSKAHSYTLSENLRVVASPPNQWGCSTEYVVNTAGIIVGFKLVGDGCVYTHHPNPWKAF